LSIEKGGNSNTIGRGSRISDYWGRRPRKTFLGVTKKFKKNEFPISTLPPSLRILVGREVDFQEFLRGENKKW